MPKLIMKKTPAGLEPDQPHDWDALDYVNVGECVTVNITKSRNIRFHRLFFSLVNLVFENQDVYDNKKDFLVEVKLKCGIYDIHVTTKGKLMYIPGSISFAKMDETEFREFFERAVDKMINSFIPDMVQDELKEEVFKQIMERV